MARYYAKILRRRFYQGPLRCPGRFHHLTYFMDSREDVLRAADILVESGTVIETGPHKHNIGQTFFLYFYEPGGNRCEIASGGYLIFDPDWKPVVWTRRIAARAKPGDCRRSVHFIRTAHRRCDCGGSTCRRNTDGHF